MENQWNEEILMSSGKGKGLHCDVCDVKLESSKAFKQHVEGKKHKKLAENKLEQKSIKVKSIDDFPEDRLAEETKNNANEIECSVCSISFSGYKPYLAHVEGRPHKKKLRKINLEKQMQGMSEVLGENEKNEGEEDAALPKPFAKCKPCGKTFYGPESLDAHMKSAVHAKVVRNTSLMENIKANNPDDIQNVDGEAETRLRCQTCNKSFSGAQPYHVHMRSQTHTKQLKKLQIAEELKEFYVSDADGGHYVCKECEKEFTDPLAFKNHLTNNSHEKMKAKLKIMELVSTYPDTRVLKPDFSFKLKSSEISTGDSSSDVNDFYIFACRICDVTLTGADSVRDHMKSKKHVAAKKTMLLKECKKQKDSTEVEKTVNGQESLKKENENNAASDKILNGQGLTHANDDFEFI